MHERQKVERIEPGFVVQEIIAEDKFHGSTLDLFQACAVFQQPESPGLGTVTKLGADQRQVQNVGAKKAMEMRMPCS